jgi:signal transduction histidine kinase
MLEMIGLAAARLEPQARAAMADATVRVPRDFRRFDPVVAVSHDARAQRVLSSVRLKVTLTLFILVLLLGASGATLALVTEVFGSLAAATRDDLEWKALQATREVARAADLGIAVGERTVVMEAFREYRGHQDVERLVVVDDRGVLLLDHGKRKGWRPPAELFVGSPGMVHHGDGVVWCWVNAVVEGNAVGRVAVVVSLERLAAADRFRRKVVMLVMGGAVAAVIASLFFVSFYLGPLLRLTEQTMHELQELNATLEHRVEERTTELRHANERLQASLAEIQSMQRELIDASRRAGMADVATAVLHNVGNVLNSVNVSAGVVAERVRRSRLAGLDKAVALIAAQKADLGRFFGEDPKGQKLPAYLETLAAAAAEERARILQELESLQKNVDHIKVIVARQQAHAKTTVGLVETVVVTEVVEDALAVVAASGAMGGVELRREMEPLPAVRLDRHKLFLILTNLLSNARNALADTEGEGGGERRITVRVRVRAGGTGNGNGGGGGGGGATQKEPLIVEVEDTGSGILAENLPRIFNHGFTTRKEGHGFGLHSSALAALEMGGSLDAHSDGPKKGARFVLGVPLVWAEAAAVAGNGATAGEGSRLQAPGSG